VKPGHPVAFQTRNGSRRWLGLLAPAASNTSSQRRHRLRPVVEAYAKGQALGWRLPEVVDRAARKLGVAMALATP